ncbi:MAG: BrnA antitoxin family protein [Treponematales bacterium]
MNSPLNSLSKDRLAEFYPKHPENLKRGRDFVQVNIELDICLWFKRAGDDIQGQINKTLRQAMRMGGDAGLCGVKVEGER